MSTLSRLKTLYLLHLSKPKSDRTIYRAVRRRALRAGSREGAAKPVGEKGAPDAKCDAAAPADSPCVRILELGVGPTVRVQRLISILNEYAPGTTISYTGVDPFEARAHAAPGFSLKEVYRQLRALGAKVKLYPGDPIEVLSQLANHLGQHDLVVVSTAKPSNLPPQAWHYLPRVVHARSMLFLEKPSADGGHSIRQVSMSELARRAEKSAPSRRAA